MPDPRSLDRRDIALAAAISVMSMAVYVVVSFIGLRAYDGQIMAAVAENLVANLSIATPSELDVLGYHTPYTAYGIGTVLLMAPAAAAEALLDLRGDPLVTLVNPAVLAVTAGVIVAFARSLGVRRWAAGLAGAGFALATTAVVQSTDGFSEPAIGLLSLSALIAIARIGAGDRWALHLLGVTTAAAIVFRPDSVVLIGVAWLALPLAADREQLRPRRLIGPLVVPVALALGWQLIYDVIRFDDPFDTGYAIQAKGQGFNQPLIEGLGILLISPGKGLFWFNPPALLGLVGLGALWRVGQRGVAAAAVLLVVVRVAFYAKWFTPAGDVAFGPRLLFPAVPVLVLAAAFGVEHVLRRADATARRLTLTVGAVSLAAGLVVAFASVAVDYPHHWVATVHSAEDRDAALHDYYWDPAENHTVVNLFRYGPPYGRWTPHLDPRPDGVGWSGIAVALVAGAAAARMARPEDEEASTTEGTGPEAPLYPS